MSDLLLESVFALPSSLMQGLVVMGLLSEGESFEAVWAGMVGGVARAQGWGKFGEQAQRGRLLPVGGRGITDAGNSAHPTSMTAAQLHSQVSRKGSPIVYTNLIGTVNCVKTVPIKPPL